MRVYKGEQGTEKEPGCAVALGTFDGLHRGHKCILELVRNLAGATHKPAGIVTFAQHPRTVLAQKPQDLLMSLEHRLRLMNKEQMDFVWVLDFSHQLAGMEARMFIERYLLEGLGAGCLVLGFDSLLGSDRVGAGDPGLLSWAAARGLDIRSCPPLLLKDGLPISSRAIRLAISEGRLEDAEAMLGRRVSVLGKVITGDGRGRRMGYRTANLDLDREVRPPFGVYATFTQIEGQSLLGSITNVGYRPTFQPSPAEGRRPDLLIETHLLDFQGELAGKTLEVHFVAKIRDERRFETMDELVEQIGRDEAKARAILERSKCGAMSGSI